MAQQVDRLIVEWDANFKKMEAKLDKVIRSNYGAASKVEKAWDKANDNIASRFGRAGIGQGLDALTARAPAATSSLNVLGKGGLFAAAGVGALTAALAGSREAARFADEISDTAKRLHVTTDALQEYRYAVRLAGGEEAGADAALEKFSVTLGKAQQGLAKSQKAFIALGFSKDQIKGFQDADSALGAVVERISGLPSQQRDAIIQQLGLEGMKPLIDEGAGAMARFREEARAAGVVMDADLIRRGAELNDQFESVQKVIDVQIKSALVDLGPILLGLLKLVGALAAAAGDVADGFRSVQNKTTEGLRDRRVSLSRQATNLGLKQIAGTKLSKPEEQALARFEAQIAAIDEQLATRAAAAPPAVPVTHTLRDTSGGGASRRGPSDSTVRRTEEVNNELAAASRDALQAMLALTENVEARAILEKAMLDQEAAQADARFRKQVAEIKADEGLSAAKKTELLAQLEVVKAKNAEALALRKQAVDRETADRLAAQALELQQTVLSGEEERLRQQLGLTRSDSERAAIALRLVDIAYQKEKAELESLIALQKAAGADTQIAEAKLAQLEAQQPGRVEQATREGSDAAQQANDVISGIEKQSSLAEDHAAMMAEVDRQRQEDVISEETAAAAKAQINQRYLEQRLQSASGFFGDLATLSSSSNKTLAAIGKAAAIAQATIDGVLAVQKALSAYPPPFNFIAAAAVGVSAAVNVAKIAGLKDGGPVVGPGGPRDDKVLLWGSHGEFMVNAPATKRWRPQLEAMNAGRAPGFADGGLIGRAPALAMGPSRLMLNPRAGAPPPVHFHLEGAVVTQELVDQMNRVSQRHAQGAYTAARRDAAGDAATQRYAEDLNA